MTQLVSIGRVLIAASAIIALAAMMGCHAKNSKDNSPVAATVNGENITEADIDFMMNRTFQKQDLTHIDQELRHKVLDSLIASRAMKQTLKKDLSADELDNINRAVKVYEEEVYVKEYLKNHVTPEPVSPEMVQAYYDKHSDEFGSEEIREFDMLKSAAVLDDSHRDKLLKNTALIRSASNWQAQAKSLQNDYGLQFVQSRSKAGLLDKSLEANLQQLKKGETSDVFYIAGQVYLLRVTNIVTTPPKPLAEVSNDIRKKIAPMLLREAVKKASDNAIASAKVERKSPSTH